jgi:hypothetical protein
MMDWSDLRQLLFRREFRIPRPEPICYNLTFTAIPVPAQQAQFQGGLAPSQQKRLLGELGVNLWRLRNRLVDAQTGKPHEDARRIYRQVDAIWETLAEAGVEIQDHTNQPYHLGQSIEALAFQPVSGLARELVVETVRPSIYFRNERLIIGQVIVGTPVEEK